MEAGPRFVEIVARLYAMGVNALLAHSGRRWPGQRQSVLVSDCRSVRATRSDCDIRPKAAERHTFVIETLCSVPGRT